MPDMTAALEHLFCMHGAHPASSHVVPHHLLVDGGVSETGHGVVHSIHLHGEASPGLSNCISRYLFTAQSSMHRLHSPES
jgi:hypothetical protein